MKTCIRTLQARSCHVLVADQGWSRDPPGLNCPHKPDNEHNEHLTVQTRFRDNFAVGIFFLETFGGSTIECLLMSATLKTFNKINSSP